MKQGYYIYNPTNNYKEHMQIKDLVKLTHLNASELDSIIQSRVKLANLGYIIPGNAQSKDFDELFELEHPDEIWVKINRDGGNYELSIYGRVRKIKPNGKKGPILKFHTRGGNKSLSVQLTIDGKKKWELVHRLVAEHYLPNFEPEKDVYHQDGKFYNNHPSNLAQLGRSELTKQCAKKRLDKKVKIICTDITTGEKVGKFNSTREVEREIGVGRQAVLENLNGRTKLAYSRYTFTYENKTSRYPAT